ncbi:ankyrin repeat domain-containing protein [Actinoplanes italicus]|uniref:Ankyrin repeat protein n=1 Tax=Actinoplanes italicus TaxID=113567 RepID=A0A2T0KHK7_9ACTN|nr:ankyrin repeat domain-containing protein [Actinoplanes italicus]PRX22908.1 ankyrin repeat protein [Actinoplanes italicus]
MTGWEGDRLELAGRRRVRRYAVPQRMIDECTAARERGDWRLACEAGDIVADFESPDEAGLFADALAGFAPDLLRWHAPRAADFTASVAPGLDLVLTPDRPFGPDTAVLAVRTPPELPDPFEMRLPYGNQRMRLRIRRAGELEPHRAVWLAPHQWDARRAGDLRTAIGGDDRRIPFFEPDGSPRAQALLGSGDDRPARTERAWLTRRSGATWAEAGLLSDTPPPVGQRSDAGMPTMTAIVDPLRLAAEARRLGHQTRRPVWIVRYERRHVLAVTVQGDTVTAATVEWDDVLDPRPRLHPAQVEFSADLALLRHGRLTPGELHPLVREALFPQDPAVPPPATVLPSERVRVRCQGDWHDLHHHAGRLTIPAHTDAEHQREKALRAFGGTSSGCFGAAHVWAGATGRLPKRLYTVRRDLWHRIWHGGTDAVLELLDAGLDPMIRDRSGRTLLHMMGSFDHERLLPRLLLSGADVNARERDGRTPLVRAIEQRWALSIVEALAEAGADPHVEMEDDPWADAPSPQTLLTWLTGSSSSWFWKSDYHPEALAILQAHAVSGSTTPAGPGAGAG